MDEGAFAYPEWHYFKFGNRFTGSWKGMNYVITPAEDTIHVAVWYGPLCSAVSEMVAQTDLPLSAEGIEKSREYLWEQYVKMQEAK